MGNSNSSSSVDNTATVILGDDGDVLVPSKNQLRDKKKYKNGLMVVGASSRPLGVSSKVKDMKQAARLLKQSQSTLPTVVTADDMTMESFTTCGLMPEGGHGDGHVCVNNIHDDCEGDLVNRQEMERKQKLEEKMRRQQEHIKRMERLGRAMESYESKCGNGSATGGSGGSGHGKIDDAWPCGEQSDTLDSVEKDLRASDKERVEEEEEEEMSPISRDPMSPQVKDAWQKAWDDDDDVSSEEDENDVGGDLSFAQRERLNSNVSKQVDDELEKGKDAVEWESGAESVEIGYAKPHLDMFSQLRVLGKGSFGKVVLAQKKVGRQKGGLFAIKILRKAHLLKTKQIARTRTERKVLSIVDHPFIMKLHFAFQTEDKLFLVLDYCAGGELFFHLCRENKFSETWTRFYTAEILLALEHLHSKGIIYRDLKPENILLDSMGHVKLGDFGLAKTHIYHPYKGAKSKVGTAEYMAPELILNFGHGFTVDYWGLGMVTYEMMTGLPPWYTEDRSKIYKRLLRAPLVFPPQINFSPHIISFIAGLLERNPKHRLGVRGANVVKCHPFFRRLDFQFLSTKKMDAPIRPFEAWKAPGMEKTKKGKFLGMFNGPSSSSKNWNHANARSLEEEVEAATANFDQTFTRMSLNSHASQDYVDEDGPASSDDCFSGSQREELHANSFVGFTFEDHEDDRPSFEDLE